MEQDKNSSDFARTTQDFPAPTINNFFTVLGFRLFVAIAVSCSFAAGVIAQRLAEPQQFGDKHEQAAQKIISPADNKQPLVRDVDLEKEVDRRADVKVAKILRENLKGVLIVRDGESQTVRFNQAAIGKKGEFTPLKNNAVYDVLNYFICSDEGYGFMSDEEKNLALLIWRSGEKKLPSHINAIYNPKGRKIEIGKPY